jgi:hypothetical protein
MSITKDGGSEKPHIVDSDGSARVSRRVVLRGPLGAPWPGHPCNRYTKCCELAGNALPAKALSHSHEYYDVALHMCWPKPQLEFGAVQYATHHAQQQEPGTPPALARVQ